ncbi:MAG: ATP-binding protein [Limnochordales bacterium]|nr:ATP-binding protein [Limnochordales bacterium]
MTGKKPGLSELLSLSERLGAIGSPSSTSQLTIDLFGSAVGKKLVGELGVFHYTQDGLDHYALGQITEVVLRNPILEQSISRSIVRERERWSTVQGRQDTHTATMDVGAVFASTGGTLTQSMLGTVPPTGTLIYCATEELLREILAPCLPEVFYLGYVYGSRLRLPMWFKHFGPGAGGAGEAYSIGIFGKTGSGKSSLAKMMLVAYARHPRMGLFVLDPMGEFGKDARSAESPSSMDQIFSRRVFGALGRPVEVFDIDNLVLDRWELWREILVQLGFFSDLGIKWGEYQGNAAEYLQDFFENQNILLKNVQGEEVLEKALVFLRDQGAERLYAQRSGAERVRENVRRVLEEPDSALGAAVRRKWRQAGSLFHERERAYSVAYVVWKALTVGQGARPLVVVDLSAHPPEIEESLWNDKVKPLLVERFLQAVVDSGERAYREGGNLNALVVIDEAHRFAPRERVENERKAQIKRVLVDAVRTTRKYGLGWLFISQTLSSLDRDVLGQLRVMFFGFGLGSGVELEALRELVGGERNYIRLYQSFKDPQSAFGEESKTFSFMVVGPVSPLAFSGAPLFFDAFTRPSELLGGNSINLLR